MVYKIYFSILGLFSLSFGLISLMALLIGSSINIWILEFPSDIFRGGWGGLILILAGLFYIDGTRKLKDIHQRAKIFTGSIMIWIVGGAEIIRIILDSIPGERSWFNPINIFLSHYLPPYHPSLFLLPFSLIVLFTEVNLRGRD